MVVVVAAAAAAAAAALELLFRIRAASASPLEAGEKVIRF